MPSVIITVSASGMMVNGQPYPKGSIRPWYIPNTDYVDLLFPWWNNQPIDGLLTGTVKWSDITGNGTVFTSKDQFNTWVLENMSSNGMLSIPAAQFTIGDGQPGTPADGSSTYLNPKMVATSKISRNGMGYLTKDTDYTFVTGGGFTLIGGDPAFHTDQVYVVFF